MGQDKFWRQKSLGALRRWSAAFIFGQLVIALRRVAFIYSQGGVGRCFTLQNKLED